MPNNLVFVDLFQSRPRRMLGRAQTWRWKALNGDNFRVLAVSSESYTNEGDAIAAIIELFGTSSNVYLRMHEKGNQLLRLAQAG